MQRLRRVFVQAIHVIARDEHAHPLNQIIRCGLLKEHYSGLIAQIDALVPLDGSPGVVPLSEEDSEMTPPG